MAKTYDFYFDFGSLASYLAHTQLTKIEADTGARPVYLPMLLGAVFKATGNASPVSVPAKGRYVFIDFKRFADSYGVPLNTNPHFPIITTTLMRAATALQGQSDEAFQRYMDAIYRAIWVEALKMNDPGVVSEVLSRAGFDPAAVLAMANEQATKDKLKSVTMTAVERGVFGVPTFFIGDHMYWGQDRIEQVIQALKS